jgi:fumarylacetoacetase
MRQAGQAPDRVVNSNFKHMYWTFAQMVAHQASNGCNLGPGDLVGSGTVSGPDDDAQACLMEKTMMSGAPITLANGETRMWLQDGDEVILRGRAQREGFVPIGFGACTGVISPAPAVAAPAA